MCNFFFFFFHKTHFGLLAFGLRVKKKNIDNLVSRKTGTVVVRLSVAVEHPGIPETRFWTPKSCNKNRTRNVRLFPRHETPFGLELSDTKRIVLPKIIIIYKKNK